MTFARHDPSTNIPRDRVMTVAELRNTLEQDEAAYLEQQCVRFAALLENDLADLIRIQSVESRWEAELRSGAVRFDFDFDREITRRYEKWVRNAERRVQQLEVQKEHDRCPDVADRFKQRVEEAKEILEERSRAERTARNRYEMLHEDD